MYWAKVSKGTNVPISSLKTSLSINVEDSSSFVCNGSIFYQAVHFHALFTYYVVMKCVIVMLFDIEVLCYELARSQRTFLFCRNDVCESLPWVVFRQAMHIHALFTLS